MKNKSTFENFIQKKIQTVDSLSEISRNKKINNKKIVLCHGTFDLLHAGHFRHFQDSKNLGDVLVVTVTSDEFINLSVHVVGILLKTSAIILSIPFL